MIISVLVAKKYLTYVTPMYESTAKLKLADIGEGVPNSNLFKNFDVFASSNKIMGEIEVLKSAHLIRKVINTLDFSTEIFRVGDIRTVELYHNSPIIVKLFDPVGEVIDNRYRLLLKSKDEYEIYSKEKKLILKGRINIPETFLDNHIIVSLNNAVISRKKNIKIMDTYEFEFLSDDKLLEKINKNLDIVSVDKDVAVIRINLKSNIPEKAAIFVNRLADVYITDYIDNKYQVANTTVDFLNTQIDEASKKLTMAENKIETYRNQKNITNIQQETETDLRKISQLKIQQTNLKMNLEAIETLNQYMAAGKDDFLALAPNFEAFTDLLSTEIIKNIKKLQAEKKDLLLVYTKEDPRVMVIDSKIKDLSNYLVESIKNTQRNLQVKYDEISMDIKEAENVFVDVPEKQKNLTIMERDFNLLQTSYNFLNEKKIEAEIAASAKISFHRIITPASIAHKPISPNKAVITILAAILGMIASIICIYAVHFLKAKVNDVTSVEKNSTIPVAIGTPYETRNREKIFSRNVLQLQLKKILEKNKILTISCNGPHEGKCYNLTNMCKVIGEQDNTVLIIDVQGDMDFLRSTPSHHQLSFTTLKNVFYFNVSSSEYTSLSGEKLTELIYSLRDKADFIVINNEFLTEEARTLLMMKIADNNLFVIDARQTPLKLVNRLELIKAEFGITNITFLLNKVGYTPSVIKEIGAFVKKLLKKIG